MYEWFYGVKVDAKHVSLLRIMLKRLVSALSNISSIQVTLLLSSKQYLYSLLITDCSLHWSSLLTKPHQAGET